MLKVPERAPRGTNGDNGINRAPSRVRLVVGSEHPVEHVNRHVASSAQSVGVGPLDGFDRVAQMPATAVMGTPSASIEEAAKWRRVWNSNRSSAMPAPRNVGRHAES